MRYLLLIYGEQSQYDQMTEAEMQADMQRWFDYTNALDEAKVSQGGAARSRPRPRRACVATEAARR